MTTTLTSAISTLGRLVLVGVFFALTTTLCHGRLLRGSRFCEYYNSTTGCPECEPKVIDCSKERDDKNRPYDPVHNYMLCYALWSYSKDLEPRVILKGCWLNRDNCMGTTECVETNVDRDVFFCCCDGDMCNKEFYHRPAYTDAHHKLLGGRGRDGIYNLTRLDQDRSGEPAAHKGSSSSGPSDLCRKLVYSLVPITAVVLLALSLFCMWRRHQRFHQHHQLPSADPSSLANTPSSSVDGQPSLDLELLEHKAKGRFGNVWKARLNDRFVAVKIFPLTDRKSFTAEVDIYKKSNMRHESILHFITAETREESSYMEFFLITEYQERGSLYDFLKANTITWAQLCRIGETMTCGLAYLHDEIPATYNTAMKPAIAHRDFKSKNVLIKSDLSACIADFGLALAFYPDLGANETHTQVGTRRYMAPEVLEGAICFNRDSFLRIDMYACSLVLWELMSRCTCVEDVVDDYRLPFEAEVGLQPSLEEMQPLVVGQKRRPLIKPAWYQSQGMTSLVATMEECWDQDADARLSAGCVNERIAQFSHTINTGGDNNEDSTTPVDTSPPPFYFGHHLQQEQHQPQHLLPEVNNRLLASSINNNQQQNQQQQQQQPYYNYQNNRPPPPPPHYLQHQQAPPVYVPNIINNNNNNNNINVHRNSNSLTTGSDTMNNSLSSSPVGMNNMMTNSSDLSSC